MPSIVWDTPVEDRGKDIILADGRQAWSATVRNGRLGARWPWERRSNILLTLLTVAVFVTVVVCFGG